MAKFRRQSAVLTNNEPEFFFKFSAALCKALGIRTLEATEFHTQANDEVELFNETIISSLGHYVEEN